MRVVEMVRRADDQKIKPPPRLPQMIKMAVEALQAREKLAIRSITI
jgi:hypothetical protein